MFNEKGGNYYISKYNNLIKIEDKKAVFYNSLSGKILFYEDLSSESLAMKINNNKTDQTLIENKFIYNNENEEKELVEEMIKVTKEINDKKLKIHLFLNEKNGKICPNFSKDLEEIIQKNYEKTISIYIYMYKAINKDFLIEFNDFFKRNNLENKITVFFMINPLIFSEKDILTLDNIKRKIVVALIDENFFMKGISFESYLEIICQKILSKEMTYALLFDIKKSLLRLVEPYFSFFMKRGEERFHINFALNPVKESFQIEKDLGLFCDPDYDLYFKLLDVMSSSPKYNLLKVIGYGIIPKIQKYLFDKKYITPTIDFCEWKAQRIYIAKTDTWTKCFKATSENDFKNRFRLRNKCNDCSFLFFCGEGCKIKEAISCPSFNYLFKILNKKIAKSATIR